MQKRAATHAPSPSAKRHEAAEFGDNDDESGFNMLDSFDNDSNSNDNNNERTYAEAAKGADYSAVESISGDVKTITMVMHRMQAQVGALDARILAHQETRRTHRSRTSLRTRRN